MTARDDVMRVSRLELALYALALAAGIVGSMVKPWAWFAGWLA